MLRLLVIDADEALDRAQWVCGLLSGGADLSCAVGSVTNYRGDDVGAAAIAEAVRRAAFGVDAGDERIGGAEVDACGEFELLAGAWGLRLPRLADA